MLEIEVKVQVQDLSLLQQQFESMGCIFSEPKIQEDHVYILLNREFPSLFLWDNALRIRKMEQWWIATHLFTLKQQTGNWLAKIEKETVIANPEQMHDAILLMGYKEVSCVIKRRIISFYKDMEICLDHVEWLGDFIELERQVVEGDFDQIQEEMIVFLSSMGVDMTHRVYVGYDILIRQKSQIS